MRNPASLSWLPSARQARIGLRLALLLLLAVAGATLLSDRPGLEAEYFALGEPWEGRPFASRPAEPFVQNASDVGDTLTSNVLFSIRWTGWWEVTAAGEHEFSLDADDGGYLRVGDELLVDTAGTFGAARASGRKALDPGFHPVEVGFYQNYGQARLAVHWLRPGASSSAVLPLADLYPGRPLALRKVLRRALSSWSRVYRQLLGVVALIAAALLLPGIAARLERPVAWSRARLEAIDGRALRVALLLALFALAFFASLPLTGTVRGGDDTAYLQAATFNNKAWFFNRYGHVYLLKLFTNLSGGDPLVGVRVWWSFVFAATVAALAVAVASVGPGLQLRTLAVTLFILLAQPTMLGLIGAGFADFSAMMFVTAGVAVCLHGLASARKRPPPRHEWHALAIGALTVGAFRSKEVGAVIAVLPLLFLIGGDGLDLRRFARRMAYWVAGAAGVLLTLMAIDWWFLDEFLFTFDSGRMAQSRKMNFPVQLAPRQAYEGWLRILWDPQIHPANAALRNLWLGTCAGALAAGLRRRGLALRLLHFLPIAYLLALIAIYVRMPHPFSSRMLITILPVASLMTGLLLHYAGLDEIPWRQMLKARVLVPGGLAAAVVILVVVPYRLGTLDAASLVPADLLLRYGWAPDQFLVTMLLPAVFVTVLAALALVVSRRRARVVALLVACLAFFGVGFELTRASLANGHAAQAGQRLLYPWRAFRAELNAGEATTIGISRDLRTHFQMSAQTQSSLASLALGRQGVAVFTSGELPRTDYAIASRYVYDIWRQSTPALEATASFDPAGFLVLVRPKQATRAARKGRDPAAAAPSEPPVKSLEERLEELKARRDPEAHADLLRWLLDSLEGPFRRGGSLGLRQLDGDRVRAVALAGDGWTHGVKPAGLIVRNEDRLPRVQELRLTVNAEASDYPISVFLDDGQEIRTVRFDRGATRRISLPPVPPRSSRLVVIWADKAWSSRKNRDARPLGVRIRAVPQP